MSKNVANLCNSNNDLNTDMHETIQIKEQFGISLDSAKCNINMQLNKIDEYLRFTILKLCQTTKELQEKTVKKNVLALSYKKM